MRVVWLLWTCLLGGAAMLWLMGSPEEAHRGFVLHLLGVGLIKVAMWALLPLVPASALAWAWSRRRG